MILVLVTKLVAIRERCEFKLATSLRLAEPRSEQPEPEHGGVGAVGRCTAAEGLPAVVVVAVVVVVVLVVGVMTGELVWVPWERKLN